MSDALARINALTETQRDAAYKRARQRVAGEPPTLPAEPTPADFYRHQHSRFPASVSATITALTAVMLVAAFLPSAIRIYDIARITYGSTIAHETSVTIAALCIVLMSEIGQVIFTLAVLMVEGERARLMRAALWFGALVCTAVALSANAVAVGIENITDVFAFLETFAPPVLTLITAQVLKAQFVERVQARHYAHQAYQTAYAQWREYCARTQAAYDDALRNAPSSANWEEALLRELWDALRDANRASKAVLRALTHDDKWVLVMRERNDEEWWRMRASGVTQSAHTPAAAHASGKRTNEIAALEITHNDDGTVSASCPRCGERFTKASETSLKNALNAHMRWNHQEAQP